MSFLRYNTAHKGKLENEAYAEMNPGGLAVRGLLLARREHYRTSGSRPFQIGPRPYFLLACHLHRCSWVLLADPEIMKAPHLDAKGRKVCLSLLDVGNVLTVKKGNFD